ncbi:cell division protein ZipA [Dyella marensis]|jgi:cell division protein ZipA|uniref:Cell division protein ZipA n=1 Tax=Dyella marensis TaxID=500610 RepID=A0A1I1ZTK0_9GAMM|nr:MULTISPECIES: cell division protein ZipA [Dyella]SFE34688.1 cell division protein ZipA [Dyella marensis]
MTMQPLLAFAWNPAVGIPLLIVGVIALGLIWLFGQPRKEQGRRRMPATAGGEERREPTFGDDVDVADDAPGFHARDDFRLDPLDEPKPKQGELDMGLREELEKLGATLSSERVTPAPVSSKPMGAAASIIEALRAPPEQFLAAQGHVDEPLKAAPVEAAPRAQAPIPPPAAPAPAPAAPRVPPRSEVGNRPAQLPVERIVTLFVVAREGSVFLGPDLIVAAEKAGLEFGAMGIYHRLLDGKREHGPIFSVANMLKPGNFDLSRLDALRTPGLSFFMTLPAPIPALDAWDAMLPTAQRLAELLDGQVLDEERNALGRQRIAHIRDELRGWDRDHEGKEIIFGR